jgi:hypothetical protein
VSLFLFFIGLFVGFAAGIWWAVRPLSEDESIYHRQFLESNDEP